MLRLFESSLHYIDISGRATTLSNRRETATAWQAVDARKYRKSLHDKRDEGDCEWRVSAHLQLCCASKRHCMAASLTTCWFAEVKQENYIEPVSWIQVCK